MGMLWRLSPDAFNEWRATNDLPLLYNYCLTKLPGFSEWAKEFQIDSETFCHTMPTGHLFIGEEPLVLSKYAVQRTPYSAYSTHYQPKDELIRLFQARGHPILDIKVVVPYFLWAKRRFSEGKHIVSDSRNGGMTDTFVYNMWSASESPVACRAHLFKEFEVLKLGGVTLPHGVPIGGRNLDFADLDFLTVEGKWHIDAQTSVEFSSCRNITLQEAELNFYRFYRCWMTGLVCVTSKLYSIQFIECELTEARFAESRLVGVSFERCLLRFDFDNCDLEDLKFLPAKGAQPSYIAEIYRRLRIAYQSTGKRHDAAQAYYNERRYETRALGYPYLMYANRFPQRIYSGTLLDVFRQWRAKQFGFRQSFSRAWSITRFHIEVWLLPKYAFRAATFKVRYMISLAEERVWGYGEKPARIIFTALCVLASYTAWYFVLLNHGVHPQSTSLVDSAYMSIATFTTLGYSDISLKANQWLKVACGSEAALGAFILGLFVAGFANKSKY
jgi:hypothetical protein